MPVYSTWQRLIPFSLWWQRHDVTSFRLGQDSRLKTILQEIALQRNQAPISASMNIQGGVVEILPAKLGRELDVESTLMHLSQQDFTLGDESRVTLIFREVRPEWSDIDVAELKRTAETLIERQINFVLPSGIIVRSSASDRASWLKVDVNEDEGETQQLIIADDKIIEFARQKLDAMVYRSPIPTVVTLLDGHETNRQTGEAGLAVDRTRLKTDLQTAWSQPTPSEINIKIKTVVLPAPETFVSNYSSSQIGLQTYYNTLADQGIKVAFKQFGGNGWQAGIGQTDQMTAASTYKLFVALRLFDEINSGRASWRDEVIPGQTVEQCLKSMIVLSHNDCAEAWLGKWGRSNINNYLYNRGISRATTFTDQTAAQTSAADLALVLEKLYYRDWFNPDDGALLNTYMIEQIYRRGVAVGSAGVVADKVGFIGEYLHDAALVYHPKGNYILVILTKGANWSQIAKITRQTEAIIYP